MSPTVKHRYIDQWDYGWVTKSGGRGLERGHGDLPKVVLDHEIPMEARGYDSDGLFGSNDVSRDNGDRSTF